MVVVVSAVVVVVVSVVVVMVVVVVDVVVVVVDVVVVEVVVVVVVEVVVVVVWRQHSDSEQPSTHRARLGQKVVPESQSSSGLSFSLLQ